MASLQDSPLFPYHHPPPSVSHNAAESSSPARISQPPSSSDRLDSTSKLPTDTESPLRLSSINVLPAPCGPPASKAPTNRDPSLRQLTDSSAYTRSPSDSKPPASAALLGDFTKLHNGMTASAAVDNKPLENSVKLGDFSKIFSRISRNHHIQKPSTFLFDMEPSTQYRSTRSGSSIADNYCYGNTLKEVFKKLSIGDDSSSTASDGSLEPDCFSSEPSTPSTTPPPHQGTYFPPLETKTTSVYKPPIHNLNTFPFAVTPEPKPVTVKAQQTPHIYRSPVRPRDIKHESLCRKLVSLRTRDAIVAYEHSDVAANGTHVFVDMSNINLCFHQTFRNRRNIPNEQRLYPLPIMDLEFLTEVMTRGRETETLRVTCSCKPDARVPLFVHELKGLDYEVDLLERVKVRDHSSDELSSPHYVTPARRTQCSTNERSVESLVDETLQSRISEVILENFDRPGTIVIATGDAKPAPHSHGFWALANRALKMGWNIEIVSWNCGLSKSWTRPDWTDQWGSRFRIIGLDHFFDEFLV